MRSRKAGFGFTRLPTAALWSLVLCCALSPADCIAQARRQSSSSNLSAGLRAGRDFENHAWSLGVQAGLRVQDRLEIRPSGDYYLGNRSPFRWQLNADLVQSFGPNRTVYGGGGAAFTKVRDVSSIRTGYNLFLGVVFAELGARTKPFAEFRWTFVNRTSPFRLVAGINRRL